MDGQQGVSDRTLRRLPLYVNYLRSLPEEVRDVSSVRIAEGLGLNAVQVRKDLSAVGSQGRPRTGYKREWLTAHLMRCLGGDRRRPAVVVGIGNLGRALAGYDGFSDYGVEVASLFDNNPNLIGETVSGKPVEGIEGLISRCKSLGRPIGILTVPESEAQAICDLLVTGGVKAIWNFAPICLKTPGDVAVFNENIAASLALFPGNTGRN